MAGRVRWGSYLRGLKELQNLSRPTDRPLSSSFLGLPYRILNINHKKELLRGLWVGFMGQRAAVWFGEGLMGLGVGN